MTNNENGNSDRFHFLGSKITADSDCSHGVKSWFLPGRKAMTNLNSILKNSNRVYLTKIHILKAMVSPVVMDRYESWTIKKAECWRIERTLESPLDYKEIQPVHPKGDQSLVFIERTDAWNFNTFVTRYEELTHLKRPWCWERLKAGGEGDDRRWDGWMASPTQWTSAWASSGRWWWTGKPGVLQSMELQRVEKTEQLNNNNKCWAKWWSLILQDNMV